MILISAGQVLVTTIVMAVYSWQLTLAVLVVFAPVALIVRASQRRLVERYGNHSAAAPRRCSPRSRRAWSARR